MRQTRLSTAASGSDRAGSGSNRGALSSPSPNTGLIVNSDLTLADLMLKLNAMDLGVNQKLDGVVGDVKDIKESFSVLQEEVGVLRKEVDVLKAENEQLKDHRDALWTQLDKVQRKVDDLEGRSKRSNLIFYGLEKDKNETNDTLEGRVKDLLSDRLELAEDIEFDRVHRISTKPDSPVIVKCTYYKQKVKILKLKNKLRGSNIFIGEDYSQNVRETRKKLTDIMKTLKSEGKNVKMAFDHLFVDGKRMYLAEDGVSVVERG
jgi:FtsZ-binding cell division protein ZapB